MRRYSTKPAKTSNPKKPKIQSKRKTKSNPKPNVSKIQKKNQIQSYPKITGIRIHETVKQKNAA